MALNSCMTQRNSPLQALDRSLTLDGLGATAPHFGHTSEGSDTARENRMAWPFRAPIVEALAAAVGAMRPVGTRAVSREWGAGVKNVES